MTVSSLRRQLDTLAKFRPETDDMEVWLHVGAKDAKAGDASLAKEGRLFLKAAPGVACKRRGWSNILSGFMLALSYVIVIGLLAACAGGVILLLRRVASALGLG